jgi:hypothetical protein
VTNNALESYAIGISRLDYIFMQPKLHQLRPLSLALLVTAFDGAWAVQAMAVTRVDAVSNVELVSVIILGSAGSQPKGFNTALQNNAAGKWRKLQMMTLTNSTFETASTRVTAMA